MDDRERKREERELRAQARGERIRTELKAMLDNQGAQSAANLLPQMPNGVSLSEVEFQLERLAEEGQVVGEPSGFYSPRSVDC